LSLLNIYIAVVILGKIKSLDFLEEQKHGKSDKSDVQSKPKPSKSDGKQRFQ